MPTLPEFLASYQYPPKSRSEYEGRIRAFCDAPGLTALPLTHFTRQIIVDRLIEMMLYEEPRRQRGRTCGSFNTIAAHLRAVFETARRQGLIQANPAAKIRFGTHQCDRDLYDMLREAFPQNVRDAHRPSASVAPDHDDNA